MTSATGQLPGQTTVLVGHTPVLVPRSARTSPRRWRNSAALAAVAAGCLGGCTWVAAILWGVQADFEAHVAMAAESVATGVLPANPLFYVLDVAFAGFSTDRDRLMAGLVAVLVVALAAKVAISVLFVGSASGWRSSPRIWLCGSVGAALCSVTFAIAPARAYPGVFPPNVWHNSTVIVLMPLAVGMFWASLAYLRTGRSRLLRFVLALAALNIVAKPSFMFCFLPVFPLAALVRFGMKRETRKAWLTSGAVAAMLGMQYAYIYVVNLGDPTGGPGPARSGGVAVDPFRVWSFFSHNIPLSMLAMYVFPIVALVAGGRAVLRNLAVRYALGLAVAGLLCAAFLKETGPREFHGNFIWQAIVANYLLFLAVLSAWISTRHAERWGARHALVWCAFFAHVVAGVLALATWLHPVA